MLHEICYLIHVTLYIILVLSKHAFLQLTPFMYYKILLILYLLPYTCCLILVTWYLLPDICHMIFVIWYLLPITWKLIFDIQCLLPGNFMYFLTDITGYLICDALYLQHIPDLAIWNYTLEIVTSRLLPNISWSCFLAGKQTYYNVIS